MTDQHPITPPPELVEEWIAQVWHEGTPVQVSASDLHLASKAAEWGARWGHQPAPPADGEVAELVEWLREQLHVCLQAPWTPGIKHFGRAAELLERQVLVPVSVSDALIKAECALSDIAEGEPMADEGDPLKWAERRCADTLAIIRPTMMQHKIRTSEWPPVAATAKPLPEVGE